MTRGAALFLLLGGCLDFHEASREERPLARPQGPSLKISVERFECPDDDRQPLELALSHRDPQAAVAGGSNYGPNGITVFAAPRDFVAVFAAGFGASGRRERRSYTLIADEGKEAILPVNDIPGPPMSVSVPLYDGGIVVRRWQALVTTSEFRATPRPGGSAMDLEIIPAMQGEDGRRILVKELASRFFFEPGRPYVFLSHDAPHDSFGRLFFTRQAGISPRPIILVLTVEASRP